MWGTHKILQCLLVLLLIVGLYENSWAVSDSMKKPCADCHIMHDSRGGVVVAFGPDPATKVGPQASLLNATCAGCHNGLNANNATDPPFVVNLGVLPTYGATGTEGNTLAGGNFRWVVEVDGDLKGHNVVGIGADQSSRTAPGDGRGAEVVTYNADNPLTCAGTYGCHGDNSDNMTQTKSIWGAHHGNIVSGDPDPAVNGIDGASIASSYRFLDGIVGWEDADAEYKPDSINHNQYKGVVRTDDVADASSISSLCARCHGNFHNGAGDRGVAGGSFGSPWLRHPVDIDMGPLAGVGTEYAGYGPAGVYNVETPLASTDVSAASNTVTLGSAGANAIITCISCHRAHGSEYDYSLRWNYKDWPGGAGINGCGHCHTEKT